MRKLLILALSCNAYPNNQISQAKPFAATPKRTVHAGHPIFSATQVLSQAEFTAKAQLLQRLDRQAARANTLVDESRRPADLRKYSAHARATLLKSDLELLRMLSIIEHHPHSTLITSPKLLSAANFYLQPTVQQHKRDGHVLMSDPKIRAQVKHAVIHSLQRAESDYRTLIRLAR